MENQQVKGMPEGAYDVLPPGKEYVPYVPAGQIIPEMTVRAVVLGLIMAVLFSAAAAFLGLKIGQVFEAAIPIAIIAVGAGQWFKRKSTILENVIVQSVGAASGLVVAGMIFTLPALFILKLDQKIGINLFKLFAASLLGGTLGILFLIPFRKYFVKEMHGQFPFPEATATAQILVAGEAGGAQAKVLVWSMIIGGIYDFLILSVNAFSEVFTTRIVPLGQSLYEKWRLVFKMDALSSVMGIGYIIGFRYTAIIAAGSLLSWFLLVPLVAYFGRFIPAEIITPGTKLIAQMSAEEIFKFYVRFIGIGAIAMAGVISIIKSSKVIVQAFSMSIRQIAKKGAGHADSKPERTQTDLNMKYVLLLLLVTAVLLFLFYRFSVLAAVAQPFRLSLIAMLTVFVISFLFTSVSARAIAIVGTNPVSGMTMMTILLSSLVLASFGLSGDFGMMAGLLIGVVVCTALSMAGGFITDLKVGYWLGATPIRQQYSKFMGTIVASATVGLVIFLLSRTYGFDPTTPGALTAPQANAMATIIKPLMDPHAQMPWILLGIGALFILAIDMISIPPLAFALGMYIPIELNTPLVIGGLIALLVGRSSPDKELSNRRVERGTLIASGFIAGGAIMGVIGALVKFVSIKYFQKENPFYYLTWGSRVIPGELCALVMFVLICLYLYWDARRAK
ncbi:MAG: oligopeptide transporter, OPT family [Candidatus Aminicenantes bacterium]|nr:oligopeptide transporter, OPT family [Candidatus Aminicenantes bacterium]